MTPQKWKNAVLFAGSILFYTAGEAEYVVLLLASVVINYVFGRLMYRDTYEGRGKKQLILLIVALCYDFGVLFLFKYSGFMDSCRLVLVFIRSRSQPISSMFTGEGCRWKNRLSGLERM